MSDTFFILKKDKENLPFPIPGQADYEDFTDPRFRTSDSKVFIRPVLFLNVSISSGTDSLCVPSRDNCCFLLYIKSRRVQVRKDGQTFHLTEGSGLLTSADSPLYLTSGTEPLSFLLLLLTGDLLWELYRVQQEMMVCFTGYEYPDFEQRINSLLKEYLNAESPLLFDFSRHMDHLLSRIIHQSLTAGLNKDKQRKQMLMHALTYMKEHCCEQILVADIAAAFGYSSSHFSKIFQAEFHQSPKQYILKLRLSYAEKLLTLSDLSIESIGRECGFNTTAHFIQRFRETHDLTPLQYRQGIGTTVEKAPSTSSTQDIH